MLSKKPQNSHGTRRGINPRRGKFISVCVTGHKLYHSDSFTSAGSSDCIRTGDVEQLECGVYMRDKSRYTILVSRHVSPSNKNISTYSSTPKSLPCPNPHPPPNNPPRLIPRITLPPNIIIIPHQRLFRMRRHLSLG